MPFDIKKLCFTNVKKITTTQCCDCVKQRIDLIPPNDQGTAVSWFFDDTVYVVSLKDLYAAYKQECDFELGIHGYTYEDVVCTKQIGFEKLKQTLEKILNKCLVQNDI